MGERTIVISLALLLLAPSSNSTLNPSNTTLSSTNPSSSSSSTVNSLSSSTITLASSTLGSTTSGTTLISTINPSVTTSSQFGFLSPKPSSSYEVTEHVIDIPDDRPLPPIVSGFGLSKPINVANTTISVNKVIKNDTGDEHKQLKKTSFTYVHITKDTEDNKGNGIAKLFRGIKDYVYNLKKGVVDGLHNYFHKDDKKKDKEESFHDKFHRSNEDLDKNDDDVDFHHKFHRSNEDLDKNDDDVDFHHKFHRSNKDLDKNDDGMDFHHKFHRSYHSDENFDDFEHDHDKFEHELKDFID